jgi:hypothetical protein
MQALVFDSTADNFSGLDLFNSSPEILEAPPTSF